MLLAILFLRNFLYLCRLNNTRLSGQSQSLNFMNNLYKYSGAPVDDNEPAVMDAKLRFGIVGTAEGLVEAVRRAVRVAPIDLSVLVTGESGVGKEFFPKIIHANSARKHAKYIAVNCGAIPEGTIDSELFGHEKGSFTGAVASRKGYFEEADGGTIFLDEVAELPMTTQARLLRVLESGEFLKVGSSTVQRTNIRIVAATNVDLRRAIAEGKFREDLYYRLSTVQIQVPALRERGNDIMLLARKFASSFAEKYNTPEITFDDSARMALTTYRWPGNVRQLKNIIEQIALFEAGTSVSADTLADYLPRSVNLPAHHAHTSEGTEDHSYAREREMLFNMIFRLRQQINELTERIDKKRETGDLTPTLEVLDVTDGHDEPQHNTLARISDIEPAPTATMTIEETEKKAIREALKRNGGLRKNAARDLNISERTLYRKIKEYSLEDL
jgi:DNA-binding NtrC family response regulator